ncbi:MAG: sugar ABC transporter permease [Spirochaetaceae bacterium]|nr:MAG: sugar ABC transporter permease [Spirochaetaceae bacterium]
MSTRSGELNTVIIDGAPVLRPRKLPLKTRLYRDRYLLMLLLPVLVFYVIFRYVPMYGLVIAFKDFRLVDGILGSQWAGLTHIERMFRSEHFFRIVRNTVLLNVYQLLFQFPAPIVLAILINEMRSKTLKRGVQSLLYVPHFISWVVMGGIIITILSPSTGIVNRILTQNFGIRPIFFLADRTWWVIVFIFSGIWKSAGWGTILYLAAITNIDPQLYEAAIIDGAGKFRQIWHITLPGLSTTIGILLILNVGGFMEVNFEQIFILQNQAVMRVADVIPTFVYRAGLLGAQFSYTTAVGFFQSIVGLILIWSTNRIIKALGGSGLF